MPQLTRCPHCQKPIQVPDPMIGKPVRCPVCKQVFAVQSVPLRAAPAALGASQAAAPSKVSVPGGTRAALLERAAPAPPAAVAQSACPACKSPLPPGAAACSECGYVLRSETSGSDSEGVFSL